MDIVIAKAKSLTFDSIFKRYVKRDRLDYKNEWEQPLEELYELFSR